MNISRVAKGWKESQSGWSMVSKRNNVIEDTEEREGQGGQKKEDICTTL